LRILLQFPEGLKEKACEIAEKLEAEGNEVFISAAPCFGACDIALAEAEACRADKIIHYGHAEFPLGKKAKIPVEYVEFRSDVDLKPVVLKALEDPEFRKCAKVGLITTVQHVGKLGEVKALLEENGKTVLIGKHGPKAKYDGQVLGCDATAAVNVDGKVDCILYVGGGLFHPIGAARACTKKVLSADPFLGKIMWLDEEKRRYEKRRRGALAAAVSAQRFGIIVSVKPGQENLRAAVGLKKAFERIGRKAEILLTDIVNPESLANFRCFDAYVNTACPRIVIDDYMRFEKPILNFDDALELVEELKKSR
jgi:2-(3-amino-3-carboxypropyl)histidine synthase